MCNQTYNYETNVIVFSRSMYVYTYVYRLQKIIKLDHSSTRSHLVQYVSNQWQGKWNLNLNSSVKHREFIDFAHQGTTRIECFNSRKEMVSRRSCATFLLYEFQPADRIRVGWDSESRPCPILRRRRRHRCNQTIDARAQILANEIARMRGSNTKRTRWRRKGAPGKWTPPNAGLCLDPTEWSDNQVKLKERRWPKSTPYSLVVCVIRDLFGWRRTCPSWPPCRSRI